MAYPACAPPPLFACATLGPGRPCRHRQLLSPPLPLEAMTRLDQGSAWLTLLSTGATLARVPLPSYLAVPAACVGVASALETLAPGFWERFASGMGDDEEERAREYAAQIVAEFLAARSDERPSDEQIARRYKAAMDEWRQLHAGNLEVR